MLGLGKSDAITQLGLPTMWMFSGEAQHGLVRGCMNGTVCPTSFPSLVGIGATGNKSLFTAIGDAISDEARAWFNILGVTKNANLCVWAPNINLARNFLWGRNEETPGEDPTINGVYGSLFISAMQDGVEAVDWDNASAPLLKTAPTLKHFLAYDVDCTNGHSEGGCVFKFPTHTHHRASCTAWHDRSDQCCTGISPSGSMFGTGILDAQPREWTAFISKLSSHPKTMCRTTFLSWPSQSLRASPLRSCARSTRKIEPNGWHSIVPICAKNANR